ncbi:MAG TPA: hypothetical protein PLN56_08455 [Methanoregulaceae archaeon]|nr:MAG: hypothetical protein IPI71_09465 [Methanolinea sp.]HON82255.1 hypothetical protein [Methanoregulaceae archaeon]HPD11014.1 hypothetical protein [Methanoregulaceae archaeon]HRT16102.1 hypothetical protein [Methanoregulaceae archaeon]HRU31641.1 hypothetical protein [Methanoregulaceae archaeon]
MKVILFLSGLCIAVCILAGCVDTLDHGLALPTVTPVPTAVPEAPPPPVTVTIVPTVTTYRTPPPLSTIPPLYAISIQVQKNPIATDPWISVHYEGSGGRVLPSQIEAVVIRSDETIEQKSAVNPARGTRILLNGTVGTDRVMVTVTYLDGSVFTVKDEVLPSKPTVLL